MYGVKVKKREDIFTAKTYDAAETREEAFEEFKGILVKLDKLLQHAPGSAEYMKGQGI